MTIFTDSKNDKIPLTFEKMTLATIKSSI